MTESPRSHIYTYTESKQSNHTRVIYSSSEISVAYIPSTNGFPETYLSQRSAKTNHKHKMASITEVCTSEAPGPFPIFSQAIKANGFVFCSGSVGFDKDTMKLVEGGIKAETVLILTLSLRNTAKLMGSIGTNTQKPCGCSESCGVRFQ